MLQVTEKATSPGPCISDKGQVIKCLDVSSVLVMYLSIYI